MRLFPPGASPTIFAVGTSDVQLAWRGEACDVPVHAATASGPTISSATAAPVGTLTLTGLEAGAEHVLTFGAGIDARKLRFRTLDVPGGPELCRFATMNDLHLGLDTFGLTKRIRGRARNTALLCAQAAFDEAHEWGAHAIVLKGDIVHRAEDAEWEMLHELIHHSQVPVYVTFGNHEAAGDRFHVSRRRYAVMGHEVEPIQVVELPGLRVAILDTTIPGSHDGRVHHLTDELVDLVADGRPTLVLHHHQMHTVPFPVTYPKGILGRRVRDLITRVAAVNPDVMFASGHTHRHRRHRRDGLTMAELGSTKDYPGTWCGYVVHEGGIVQTVRRIADPVALAWTERTGNAVLGLWSRWSPGSLDDRCFSVNWRQVSG